MAYQRSAFNNDYQINNDILIYTKRFLTAFEFTGRPIEAHEIACLDRDRYVTLKFKNALELMDLEIEKAKVKAKHEKKTYISLDWFELLEQQENIFSQFYIAILKASENSGSSFERGLQKLLSVDSYESGKGTV